VHSDSVPAVRATIGFGGVCARLLLGLDTLAAFGSAHASQAEPQIAGGKSDLEVPSQSSEVLESFGELQLRRAIAEPADGRDQVSSVPSLATSDSEDFFRYNLVRLDVPWSDDYKWDTFRSQVSSIRWDVAGFYGLAALIGFGFEDWNWGTTSFHFTDEGWFGKNTKYLGMDKLGHAFTGYMFTEYFAQRIAHSTEDRAGAAVTGAFLGMGLQTYVEVLDGFSDNGFSFQDFVADAVGCGFSILRSTIPGLADKLDFRLEYVPSGNDEFSPVQDYSGQKYLLALKLSGFEEFENTPLRFVEFQAGYYARGFTENEQENGDPKRREPYFGIGINLQELLDRKPISDTTPIMFLRSELQYIQVPYTYLSTN
jgi:hypothetical protein